MPPSSPVIPRADACYLFDDFELDVAAFELRNSGLPVAMEPQVFELLAFLVANAERALTKDELLDAIWPERYVTEAALNSRIMSARKALGDDGRSQHYIKTIHGRGYRFAAPVNVRALGERPPVQPSAPAVPPPGALLPAATSFVGREAELARLHELLSGPDARLITIVGPGGIGKTRLATEAAAATPNALFVGLQSAADVRQAAFAMADTLGVRLDDVNHCDQIVEALRGRRMLLVLDNVEHLIEEAAPYLSQILAAAPEVRILVTSRAVLGLAEEWVFRVEGLDVTGEDSPAVRLFEQRAGQASANASVPAWNREAVAELCRLVDGMPLAIELAAALTRYYGIAELVELVGSDPTTLAADIRNLPERHRSIAALFSQAFDRLTPDEQRALEALSVFDGCFSAPAAAAIAGAGLPQLCSLVDRSLVHARGGRFHLHPLMRQFAAERCSGYESSAALHAEYFAAFLEARQAALEDSRQLDAVAQIGAEYANITRAWRWAAAAGRTDLLDRALPLFSYLSFRGRFLEADELIRVALPAFEASTDAPGDALAQLHVSHAWVLMRTGRPREAAAAAGFALRIYQEQGIDPRPGIGRDPLLALAGLKYGAGDYAGVHALSMKARERAIVRGDRAGAAFACWLGGMARTRMATYEWVVDDHGMRHYRVSPNPEHEAIFREGTALVEEGAAILERLDETWLRGYIEIERANALSARGDLRSAIDHLEQARELREAFGDPQGVSSALISIGDQYIGLGDYELAADYERRARELVLASGDATGLAEAERLRARWLLRMGRVEEGREAVLRTIRQSQRVRFANNVVSGISLFAELMLLMGRRRLAAQALAFTASNPVGTPFTRAAGKANLALLTPQLAADVAEECLERAGLESVDTMAERVVEWLELPAGDEPETLYPRQGEVHTLCIECRHEPVAV